MIHAVPALALALTLFATPSPPCHVGAPAVPQAELTKAAPTDAQARAGASRDPVTTKSKAARAAYERGLALYHAYDWIRAARSFHEALKKDPELASAHWGLSRVYEQMDERALALDALRDARAHAAGASDRERARIEAWGAALAGLEDETAADRHAAYREALDAALAKWPDDAELLLMRGNAAAPLPPGYAPYQNGESVPFFQRVLAKNPDHAGAHHYLVHALENDGRFEKAAEHGARVAALGAGAPHLVHMDGHGLMRNGKVAKAIARFEETDRLGAAIRAAEKIDVANDWHHSHNLSLLASAYRREGRMKDAEKTIRRLAEVSPVGEDALMDRKDLAAFLLARGRYEEALAAADVLAKSRLAETRAIAHAMAGEALLAQGKASDASLRHAQALEERRNVTGELATSRTWVASLWVDELGLALLLATNATEHANEKGNELIANHTALRGPDGWVQATFRLERIALLARSAGNWTLAEAAANALARHDPGYAGTHLALAAVARHAGKIDVAVREEAAAKKAWSKADPGLISP